MAVILMRKVRETKKGYFQVIKTNTPCRYTWDFAYTWCASTIRIWRTNDSLESVSFLVHRTAFILLKHTHTHTYTHIYRAPAPFNSVHIWKSWYHFAPRVGARRWVGRQRYPNVSELECTQAKTASFFTLSTWLNVLRSVYVCVCSMCVWSIAILPPFVLATHECH